ncbi:hypothetical protein [Bradyrhizobium sp. CCGUVB23]|uniref:hypothetical protein n=1 Tax=Bradyrhizobium sp. CCGUVB23 TaxID=2949630 RepID=UPI0020B245F9|nr:hypothetical protein [Bradyrhizobium sp. CCGUVB23]MCP3460561.1 hypothetical protein [Bradyrhizobium sp. CCGUVB23]
MRPGGKVQKAYRRGMMFKARIAIMRDWANHCTALPPTARLDNDNVVPMGRSA